MVALKRIKYLRVNLPKRNARHNIPNYKKSSNEMKEKQIIGKMCL